MQHINQTLTINCDFQKTIPPVLRGNDLTGRQFGFLKVIKRDKSITDRTYWICECKCGNIVSIYGYSLTSGATISCGCKRKTSNKKPLQTITYKGEEKPVVEWCKIMNIPAKLVYVRLNKLHWSPEKALETPSPEKKSVISSDRTRIHNIWRAMHARCEKSNATGYKYYGGRGIKVCPEWNDFDVFYTWAINHGYQSNLTIDRENNNGNYEPNNCRWITQQEQRNNTSANHYVTWGNDTHTLAEWARIVGIHHTIIGHRLKQGMSVEDALTTPARKNKRRKYLANNVIETVGDSTTCIEARDTDKTHEKIA